jgi:two-component system, sensor histidine kinase and response regulator
LALRARKWPIWSAWSRNQAAPAMDLPKHGRVGQYGRGDFSKPGPGRLGTCARSAGVFSNRSPGTEAAIARAARTRMPRILVVDDDEALRGLIRQCLESANHEVIEAEDGAAGVQLACAHLPDLVLCDVRMEKMDGYRTLAALRQHSVTASLPFILMTGQADTAGMRQGMELGADDYLPKPFSIPQLLGAVDARLKKQQTVREHAERRLAELRANISLALPHELLTPLNGIFGFTDIIISEHANLQADEMVSMAEGIRDSARRLHHLINKYLLFMHLELASIDRAHLQKPSSDLDFCPVIEKAAQACADASNRSADLLLELAEGCGVITEEYLSRIVEEVAENAFKFSVPGTPVTITSWRQDNSYTLKICDRGRGMKVEHIAEIGAYMQFERRFYEQQGPGLGLWITRRLAELHGGSLSIVSEMGAGTTVEIRLACQAARP